MGAVKAPEINLWYGTKDDWEDKFEKEQLICKFSYAVPGEMILAPHLLTREIVKIYLENGCVDICLSEETNDE